MLGNDFAASKKDLYSVCIDHVVMSYLIHMYVHICNLIDLIGSPETMPFVILTAVGRVQGPSCVCVSVFKM